MMEPLLYNCLVGDKETVITLLDQYQSKDNNEDNQILINRALVCACINNHVEIIKILLNKELKINADIGHNTQYPLRIAFNHGNINTCLFLIDNGADIYEGMPDELYKLVRSRQIGYLL